MEVTTRCFQARFLLRPSRALNEIIVGIVGRAQRLSEIEVITLTVLSNHVHLLVKARDAHQLANFMRFVKANIAKKVGRLHHWKGTFWEKRYTAIPVSDEEAAQVARLRYLLEQGTKEDLVLSPKDWPGVHAARGILSGRPLRGTWIDGSALCEARRRKRTPTRKQDFQTIESLYLSPLPCWEHLSTDEYRRRVQDLVRTIEEEALLRHRKEGSRVLGRGAVLRFDPHHQPDEVKQTPAPLVHAATKTVRQRFRQAYGDFVRAYRHAAERLRNGVLDALFPPGSFPPPRPFVGTAWTPSPK